MKILPTIAVFALALTLGLEPAASQDAENKSALEREEVRRQYEQALEAAEIERKEATEAVARARENMSKAHEEHSSAREKVHGEHRARVAEMREELSRVHEELRQASREVARVHRELNRDQLRMVAPGHSAINLGDRAVIGVVLGDSTGSGVEVLGVSPDGPSDRAGIKQGDVIISMMGRPLAGDDPDDARRALREVMEGVEVGEEITITVDRDGTSHEYTVTADKREPFVWQSIVRLPSAPVAPGAPPAPMVIEHIDIPEIDEEVIRAQVERIREDVENVRIVIDTERLAPLVAGVPGEYEYRFETFSDIGDDALREANVWFGLPATRGLKLAEVNKGLGQYFDTDRGVLVLKAKDDNDLQLQSGDVILNVGGKEVGKPSDVMRALRDWDPGSTIEIGIKRDGRNKTLDVVLPEKTLGFDFVPFGKALHLDIHNTGD